MFGKNRLEGKIDGDGSELQVVKGSPFLTIQGEGPYSGYAAVFVRLHGCPLACTFCDTRFDDPDDPIVPMPMLARRIWDMADNGRIRLCVITGGEPFRQPILPLSRRLVQMGFRVQIETAGISWIPNIETFATIVCSPKTPAIHEQIRKHAAAFKYVIDAEQEFDPNSEWPYVPITATQKGARSRMLATPRKGAPVYLSPCDVYDQTRNKANRALVAAMGMRYGVIAGCQLHKVLEIEEPQ